MRKMAWAFAAIAVVAVLFGSASRSGAQTFKIGFIYMDEIRQKGQPYLEAIQRLQTVSQQRQQEAQTKQGEIQRLQEQLQRQASLMTEQRRTQSETQIRQKVTEYEQWAGQAQQEMQQQQLQAVQPLDERVMQIVERIANERGYDVVLDGSAVAFIKNKDQNNITEAVIQALNQQ
jgi:outer membrane protein